MKKSERGQALIDFLLLLVVLIGIPLGLLFRYNVQLRHASVRAVRGMGMALHSWRGDARKAAPQCKTAPAAEKKAETPAAAPAEKAKPEAPASAPAEQVKPATPAAPAK